MKEKNPIIAVMLFIFLIAALYAVNSLPSYFTETQRMIMYLLILLGFGIALGFTMK
jgi:hypothetical protein